METLHHDYVQAVETLLTNSRDSLDSPTASQRVYAMNHLARGVELLERQVVWEAQASGMSWAEIGRIYGVSRQAAHSRFANETVVPADYFDVILKELDEPAELVPTLNLAAKRAHGGATR